MGEKETEELKVFITTSLDHIERSMEDKKQKEQDTTYEQGVFDGLTTILNFIENTKKD